jgi:hypothetical protein
MKVLHKEFLVSFLYFFDQRCSTLPRQNMSRAPLLCRCSRIDNIGICCLSASKLTPMRDAIEKIIDFLEYL